MKFTNSKKHWIILVTILVLVGYWAAHRLAKKSLDKDKTKFSKAEGATYWTCPMHPFIHLDHAGECPICHMKLVQVKAEQSREAESIAKENRADVQVSREQLNLIGNQKHEVEKMSLRVSIPVSGRFISNSSVAFQIYESDLRYVKSGLTFTGESSFYPEEKISGRISSVDSIVDPTSRTVRVVGSVKNGGSDNNPETGFRGDIQFELHERVAIPESSVLHTGNHDLVYLFTDGNKLSARPVSLGLKSEGFYDVLDGLKPGDNISSGPNFLIDSEAKIRGAGITHDQSNH